MARPRRKYQEEVAVAEQTFDRMREVDVDLLGLADDIDAIFYGENRVPQGVFVPEVEPGPVKVYKMVDGKKVLQCERPMTPDEVSAWEKSERGDG